MGRPITITVDSDDLCEMFYDRVSYWGDKIPYGIDGETLFYGYYEEMVDDGVFDDMKDFSIAEIVDNDIINNLDVVKEKDLADYGIDLDDDDTRDRIVYSDGKLFLIDARG